MRSFKNGDASQAPQGKNPTPLGASELNLWRLLHFCWLSRCCPGSAKRELPLLIAGKSRLRLHSGRNQREIFMRHLELRMTATAEYRGFRDECFRWAAKARSDEERCSFLEMAKTWHQAALVAELRLDVLNGTDASPKRA